MANAIASIITSAQLTPKIYAAYLRKFLKEVTSFDYSIYEKYGTSIDLPKGQYGDTTETGDTGGDAARTAGVSQSTTDGFKVTAWDDIAFHMNYGFTVDGVNDADYGTDLDNNFTEFEIMEGTGYANGTDYKAHNKNLTNKFYVNIPIVRYGATNQYDTLSYGLLPSSDTEEIMKQFGNQAKMVQAQYIRATLINMSTQGTAQTITGEGTDLEKTAFATYLNTTKLKLKLRGAEQFSVDIKASDGVGTLPGRAGYVAIISSQMENVISSLPGFLHYTEYGTQAGMLPNEYGQIPGSEIRFVTNDILVRQSAGSAVGIVDVMTGEALTTYNMLVMGKDAYMIASLAGEKRYELFIDAPGKGNDTLRIEKNCGWKSMIGCAVTRPAYIINVPITIV